MALAYAVESVNLHRRIALFVLKLVGTSTKWFDFVCFSRWKIDLTFVHLRSMAGLMGVTAFLSMWINNSAATSIMLPVALAITDELANHSRAFHNQKNTTNETNPVTEPDDVENEPVEVLDLTKVDRLPRKSREEIILDAMHIEEPYVKKISMRKKSQTESFLFSERRSFRLF